MLHFLFELGLFLAEAIIIVVSILTVFLVIFVLLTKDKLKQKGKIEVKSLNEHFDELTDSINKAALSKSEQKKLNKEKKKALKKKKNIKVKKSHRIFVIGFEGDIYAHAVNGLREEISAILTVATPEDEVVICVESSGGVVNGYGLGASQLQRIKDKKIPLTVAIDTVAASGGYLMACVADKIISAPFAIVGSIGVVAQLPNFNKLLKKHNIDFEQVTAGQYKRTLTLFGENTDEGRKKIQEDVNEIHDVFKNFVLQHRPQIELNEIATGEHWLGTRALELKLVDKLQTSDDYLLQYSSEKKIFKIEYKEKKKLLEKLELMSITIFNRLFTKTKI